MKNDGMQEETINKPVLEFYEVGKKKRPIGSVFLVGLVSKLLSSG